MFRAVIFDLFHTLTGPDLGRREYPKTNEVLGIDDATWQRASIATREWRLAGLVRETDRPDQKYRLAFVAFADDPDGAEIELTYNYGVDRYDLGTAFGHIAVAVPDAAAACAAVRAKGGKVTREAGPVKGGTTVIAFVEDPDGYKIELIEHKR